jgi:hypothetical protein
MEGDGNAGATNSKEPLADFVRVRDDGPPSSPLASTPSRDTHAILPSPQLELDDVDDAKSAAEYDECF